MNNEEEIEVISACSKCGMELAVNSDEACSCGHVGREISLSICDSIKVYESLRGEVKNPSFPSNKNPRIKFIEGDDFWADRQKFVKKSRRIDRGENQYRETITDPHTSEIIRHCEEPLSEHWGHGSAKMPRDKRE